MIGKVGGAAAGFPLYRRRMDQPAAPAKPVCRHAS